VGPRNPDFGARHLTARRVLSQWRLRHVVAVVVSIFSYLSIEMIAVAASRAARSGAGVSLDVVRLVFYLCRC
jgi:L-asparagine transporter-like permease